MEHNEKIMQGLLDALTKATVSAHLQSHELTNADGTTIRTKYRDPREIILAINEFKKYTQTL